MLVVNIRYPVVSRVMHGFDLGTPFHSISSFHPVTPFRLALLYSRMHPMVEARIAPSASPYSAHGTSPCCLSYHDIMQARTVVLSDDVWL